MGVQKFAATSLKISLEEYSITFIALHTGLHFPDIRFALCFARLVRASPFSSALLLDFERE